MKKDEAELKTATCTYCRGTGFHGDDFTGGEVYCSCKAGKILQLIEECQ